jgi:hypothetical protein
VSLSAHDSIFDDMIIKNEMSTKLGAASKELLLFNKADPKEKFESGCFHFPIKHYEKKK